MVSIWLVVTGTMEWIMTFQKQLGMSSLLSDEVHHFSKGLAQSPSRKWYDVVVPC